MKHPNRKFLYRITLRALGLTKSETASWQTYILSKATTEKEVVNELLTQKFTPEWWKGNLLQDIAYIGEIWFEAGSNLNYGGDD